MSYIACIALVQFAILVQSTVPFDRSRIEIINTGKYIPVSQTTEFDVGPEVGHILNYHYFPGINLYNGGRYKEAEAEFTYVITRPQYIEDNPRRAEFLSTACYLRGMIYLYHANGLGRQSIAKEDFESALKWNPLNHVVYLELSRLYSNLGFDEPATAVLEQLLSLTPSKEIEEEARAQLGVIEKTKVSSDAHHTSRTQH